MDDFVMYKEDVIDMLVRLLNTGKHCTKYYCTSIILRYYMNTV